MKVLGRKNRNRLISAFAALIFILLAMTPLVPEAEISSCLMIGALGIDSVGGVVRLTAETSTATSGIRCTASTDAGNTVLEKNRRTSTSMTDSFTR